MVNTQEKIISYVKSLQILKSQFILISQYFELRPQQDILQASYSQLNISFVNSLLSAIQIPQFFKGTVSSQDLLNKETENMIYCGYSAVINIFANIKEPIVLADIETFKFVENQIKIVSEIFHSTVEMRDTITTLVKY